MSEPVMEARGVVKFLGQGAGKAQALRGVDLTLHNGELALLMGPSGSGKTTLLSVLGCILSPSEGGRSRLRKSDDQSRAGAARQIAARAHRLRVPVLSSVSDAHRSGQCSAGAGCARRAFQQSRQTLERRARACRPRSQNQFISTRAE